MRGWPIAQIVLIVLVTAALGGCSMSASSRFYTLDSTIQSGDAPGLDTSVAVGPVAIPVSVDRPQIVSQITANRVTIDEFNRWAAPLDDGIAHVVAENLQVLLGTRRVTMASSEILEPAYRVAIEVERFEAVPDKSALIEALWTVRKSSDGKTDSGHTIAREKVRGKGFDMLVAAYSRALAQLSRDIAATIRAQESKYP